MLERPSVPVSAAAKFPEFMACSVPAACLRRFKHFSSIAALQAVICTCLELH